MAEVLSSERIVKVGVSVTDAWVCRELYLGFKELRMV
jgi:hypothetical protein